LKKASSILLFIFFSKFVSGQSTQDYYDVFYENNILKDKDIQFQNYWAWNYFITDSAAKAQKLKNVKVTSFNSKWEYTHTLENVYDKAGRNTYYSNFIDYKKNSDDYTELYFVIYKQDTGYGDFTRFQTKNGKIDNIYKSEKISDTLQLQITMNGKMQTKDKWLSHIDNKKLVYLTEHFEGTKEKLKTRTEYNYYPNKNIQSKYEYDRKGKLFHSWLYMDCGTTSVNKKNDKIDTINICKTSSVDKDGNIHTYITYTTLKGIVYKYEKVFNKAGILIKHFSINQKTGHYYNIGESRIIADTLQYNYILYNDENGKKKEQNTYSYINDKIVSREIIRYKKGKEKTHEKHVFHYDTNGILLKKTYTSYTDKYSSESVYSYQYY